MRHPLKRPPISATWIPLKLQQEQTSNWRWSLGGRMKKSLMFEEKLLRTLAQRNQLFTEVWLVSRRDEKMWKMNPAVAVKTIVPRSAAVTTRAISGNFQQEGSRSWGISLTNCNRNLEHGFANMILKTKRHQSDGYQEMAVVQSKEKEGRPKATSWHQCYGTLKAFCMLTFWRAKHLLIRRVFCET